MIPGAVQRYPGIYLKAKENKITGLFKIQAVTYNATIGCNKDTLFSSARIKEFIIYKL